ncbi:unnamed protein product [Bursaphelenchus xylophilus]|uniref:(pine wood nematode) hypothetical protein n=1 Tax=Bursaphelenchus xylophilus TaxID=6326 RepID=A0A1I7SRU7_BURXY|nr:unnamed protein product [Bursaphelenchus xylophilus]CAG9101835.1 unnamed protein product [Bursaphelenchus xylophilus]
MSYWILRNRMASGYQDPYANLTAAERSMWLYDPYAQGTTAAPAATRAPYPRPLMETPAQPYVQRPTNSGYGAPAYGTQGYGNMAYVDPYQQDNSVGYNEKFAQATAAYTTEEYNERFGPGYGAPVKPVMNFFGGSGSLMAKKGAKHAGATKEAANSHARTNDKVKKKKKAGKGANAQLPAQRKAPPPLSPPKPAKAALQTAALTAGTEGYVKANKIGFYKLVTPAPVVEKENKQVQKKAEKKPASPIKQQEPLLALTGEIPDFLKRSNVLTETRKRKIRYRVGLWCRIVGWTVESIFKTDGWYATCGQPSKYTVKVTNFYPEIFNISAIGTVFEELSYKLVTNWIEMWYYKGILSDKMIFNIYEKDARYSSEIFQASKRCFLTLIDEILKEGLPEELKTGERPFTDEEKARMDAAFARAAERISNNDLASDESVQETENGS